MEPLAYRLMAETERRHWWWAARRTILRAVLSDLFASGTVPAGTLYDLGCGVGSNLDVLAAFGPAVGYDGSQEAVALAHSLGRANVHLADITVDNLPENATEGSGSVVLLADVLEHLDDEAPALSLASRLLSPGGVLVATVPAFAALWGPADVFLHHRRRYTRRQLTKAVQRYLSVERASYFNFLLFGPIAAVRLLSRILPYGGSAEDRLPPPPVNAALRAVFSAEVLVVRRGGFPLGVSLLCVARKRR